MKAPLIQFLILLGFGFACTQAEEPNASDKIAFLGVATKSVDPALSSYLDLPEGIGLVVEHVVEDSAAKDLLKAKDLLHKFDGQLLTSPHHLAILVRSKQPGDKAEIDYLRKGEAKSGSITLGATDAKPLPLIGAAEEPGIQFDVDPFQALGALGGLLGGANMDLQNLQQDMAKMMKQAMEQAGPAGMQLLDGAAGDLEKQLNQLMQQQQGFNFDFNFGNGNHKGQHHGSASMTTQGNDGIKYTYKVEDDKKHFKATSPDGKILFDGPVNDEADRNKIPANLLEQLAVMEKNTRVNGNGAMAFQFDMGDFGNVGADLDLENLPGFEMFFPKNERAPRRRVAPPNRPEANARPAGPEDGVVSIIEDDLTVSISERDGAKHCKALDTDGKTLFDGPIDTKAQRAGLPKKVRAILEDMKAIDVDKGIKLKNNEEAL